MNFQWNNSGSDRQVGDRTQAIPHWPNQEQYGQGNLPTNQYNAFRASDTSSRNWNTGVGYHQWCSSSQEQMNWPSCSSTYPNPNNPYNQAMTGNFATNTYPNYSQTQSKSSYRENFAPLYNETERSNNFEYQMTNLMVGQTNNNYGMPQNNFLGNCQDSTKLCENLNAPTNNFSYWNLDRNGEEPLSYVPHPLYSSRAACDTMAPSNMAMKVNDMGGNQLQNETMQNFNKSMDVTPQRQLMKTNATNPRFSLSQSSDYFLGMMSNENASSNMSSILSDSKKSPFYDSFNLMNTTQVVDSSMNNAKVSNVRASSTQNSNFGSIKTNGPQMTHLQKKEDSRFEEIVQRKILFIEKRILEKSAEFEKIKRMSNQTIYDKTYGEMYHLITEIKALECELENIESEIKMKIMGHNVPSYIDHNEHTPLFQRDCSRSSRDEAILSNKTTSIRSLRQHLSKLKGQVSQHLNEETKPDPPPGGAVAKGRKPEEQADSTVTAKSGSVKQVRRAVLKYLLKLSSQIENCFRELRNVKRILKDNPNNKEEEVIEILQRVGMHINQSRLSLKEKKKLCANSNIRLRSLTIKSTGTNILQTLETDMFHLRRFYTALNHIARHLGTIEKVPQDRSLTNASFSSSHSADNGSEPVSGDETKKQSSLQGTSNSAYKRKKVIQFPPSKMQRSRRDACLNGPPQKSARYMDLERKYWDQLMEASYLLRSKILALRQAERAYKNGEKGSLQRLRSLCEARPKGLKRELRSLIESKKKNHFSRHIPSYILESYPEPERRSRDKITVKCVRKNLTTFMSLCYSTQVLIKGDSEEHTRQEARFWKRIVSIMQKIQFHQSELSKVRSTSSSGGLENKDHETIVKLEAKVREIQTEIEKEEICRQKNGFSDTMPSNIEIQKRKISLNDCRNMHMLRESYQSLKAALAEVKLTPVTGLPSLQLSCANNSQNQNQGILPVLAENCDLTSDLAHFLGGGGGGWL